MGIRATAGSGCNGQLRWHFGGRNIAKAPEPRTRHNGCGFAKGRIILARTRARHARARQPLRVTIPASITILH